MDRVCSVKYCDKECHAKGLCHKHYLQMTRQGGIKERTRYDANDIVAVDGVLYMIIRNMGGQEVARTLIDADDVERISLHKWHLSSKGYVVTNNEKGSTLGLHRFINNTPEGYLTDHADGNILNNRKTNLRTCNTSENGANTEPNSCNKSGVKGVWWNKACQKWETRMTFRNKSYYLGVFTDKNDAIKAYNNKLVELQGGFAKVNPVKEK